MDPLEFPELEVSVTQVTHAPEIDGPPGEPHVFLYFITIKNRSDETITIKGRKWVVVDESGQTQVVEGDGVVGEFPRLAPGEQFHYNSSHTIATAATAEGAYLGLTDSGLAIFTRIPPFKMRVPQ